MTTKLSKSQLVILSTACQREDRSVYPITAKLTGGALSKVLASLLTKTLIEEIPAKRDEQVWRSDADDARFTLRATPAACAALGIETSVSAQQAGNEPGDASHSRRARRGKAGAMAGRDDPGSAAKKPPRAYKASAAARAQDGASAPGIRTGTKQALLIDMLRRPEGAMIDEIVAATGWQKHTIRGAIAGALKKKLGLSITSERIEGRGRVYRIA